MCVLCNNLIHLLVFKSKQIINSVYNEPGKERASHLSGAAKVRSVEQNAHQAATNETGNGNGHEPRENQEEDTLPVDGLESAVAQTDTDGGTGDAHGGGDGKRVLGEDEDGNGSAQLHGGTTAGRVVGDLVAHDLHDVVAISDEADADGEGHDGNLPQRNGSLGTSSLASGPSSVHDSPDTDGVADIVGTVSEGSSAGSDDLDKRVQELDLVGVLLGVVVDASHALALGGALDANLSGVNVVVGTVEESGDNHGRNALAEGDEVGSLVDGTGTHAVVVQGAHGPTKRAAALAEFGMVSLESLGHQLLVAILVALGQDQLPVGGSVDFLAGKDGVVLALEVVAGRADVRLALSLGSVVLDNGIVGDAGLLGVLRGGAPEEHGAVDDVPEAQGVVLLDNLGVDKGHEEEGRHDKQTKANTKSDGNDVPGGLLGETQAGGALVDNGEGADGAGNEEEEGRGPDGPGNRVLALVNGELDEHEDDGGKDGRDGRGHGQTGKDGTETRALVPSPLDAAGADSSDTDTSKRRDERVGGRDVGRVASAPHHPDGGTGSGAGESKELHAGIVLEGSDGDDAVLDGAGAAGTDGERTEHFKDQAENHGGSV